MNKLNTKILYQSKKESLSSLLIEWRQTSFYLVSIAGTNLLFPLKNFIIWFKSDFTTVISSGPKLFLDVEWILESKPKDFD